LQDAPDIRLAAAINAKRRNLSNKNLLRCFQIFDWPRSRWMRGVKPAHDE
jgi:hypothetical protein